MKQHNKYALLGLKALERAAAKVAENARKNKYKIPVWKNGRIEYEIPGIITDRDRSDPHRPPLPPHAAYGSVLRGSADRAESDPGERKS